MTINNYQTLVENSGTLPKNSSEQAKFNYHLVKYSNFTVQPSSTLLNLVKTPIFLFKLIKSIYHLAVAILMGIPIAICGDKGMCLKKHTFCSVRSLQEGLGFLIRPFHNKWGQFWIEEGRFHQKMDSSFIKMSAPTDKAQEESRRPKDLLSRTELVQRGKSSIKDNTIVEIYEFIKKAEYTDEEFKELVRYCSTVKKEYALTLINLQYPSGKPGREPCICDLARAFLNSNQLEEAWKALADTDTEEGEKIAVDIVHAYLKISEEAACRYVINNFYLKNKKKENFFCRRIHFYIKSKQPDTAFEILKEYSFTIEEKTRQLLFKEIIDVYLEPNHLENFLNKEMLFKHMHFSGYLNLSCQKLIVKKTIEKTMMHQSKKALHFIQEAYSKSVYIDKNAYHQYLIHLAQVFIKTHSTEEALLVLLTVADSFFTNNSGFSYDTVSGKPQLEEILKKIDKDFYIVWTIFSENKKNYVPLNELIKEMRRKDNEERLQKKAPSIDQIKIKKAYKTLKIPEAATEKEISKAFRKLAMEHHPDRGGDEEMFKEIQAAHELLLNLLKK